MRKLKPAILLAVSVLIFLIGGAHGIAKTNEIEEVIGPCRGKEACA